MLLLLLLLSSNVWVLLVLEIVVGWWFFSSIFFIFINVCCYCSTMYGPIHQRRAKRDTERERERKERSRLAISPSVPVPPLFSVLIPVLLSFDLIGLDFNSELPLCLPLTPSSRPPLPQMQHNLLTRLTFTAHTHTHTHTTLSLFTAAPSERSD